MSNLDFFITIGNANSAGAKRKLKNDITPNPPKMPEVISIKRNTDNKLPKLKNRICQSCLDFLLISDSFTLSELAFSISFGFIYTSPRFDLPFCADRDNKVATANKSNFFLILSIIIPQLTVYKISLPSLIRALLAKQYYLNIKSD